MGIYGYRTDAENDLLVRRDMVAHVGGHPIFPEALVLFNQELDVILIAYRIISMKLAQSKRILEETSTPRRKHENHNLDSGNHIPYRLAGRHWGTGLDILIPLHGETALMLMSISITVKFTQKTRIKTTPAGSPLLSLQGEGWDGDGCAPQ